MTKPSAAAIAQLHSAAANNRLDEIKAWAGKYGAENIDARDDKYQRTALIWAAAEKREGAARLLLELGANPDATALNGHAPLTLAAINDSAGIITALLDHGATIDLKPFGGSALEQAVSFGNDDATAVLLGHGASLGQPEENNGAPSLSVLRHAFTEKVTEAVMQENKKRVGAEADTLATQGLPNAVQPLKKIRLKTPAS